MDITLPQQAITLTLPDGSQRHFDHPVTVAEVAATIGAGLARNTVAGKFDEQLVDARASQAPDAAARSKAQRRLCVRLHRQHTSGEAVVDALETAS